MSKRSESQVPLPLADFSALSHAMAACQAFERIGWPEGELALVQSVIGLTTAPKSNACSRDYGQAGKAAKKIGSLMPPKQILNAPTGLVKDQADGAGY